LQVTLSISLVRPERWRPRSAVGRPIGTVADALTRIVNVQPRCAWLSTSRRRR